MVKSDKLNNVQRAILLFTSILSFVGICGIVYLSKGVYDLIIIEVMIIFAFMSIGAGVIALSKQPKRQNAGMMVLWIDVLFAFGITFPTIYADVLGSNYLLLGFWVVLVLFLIGFTYIMWSDLKIEKIKNKIE